MRPAKPSRRRCSGSSGTWRASDGIWRRRGWRGHRAPGRGSRSRLGHRRPCQQLHLGVGAEAGKSAPCRGPERGAGRRRRAPCLWPPPDLCMCPEAKILKRLVLRAIDDRVLFNPADLVFCGLDLEKPASVLHHLERLAVDHLRNAVADGRHAVMQISLLRGDVDHLGLMMVKPRTAAGGQRGQQRKPSHRAAAECRNEGSWIEDAHSLDYRLQRTACSEQASVDRERVAGWKGVRGSGDLRYSRRGVRRYRFSGSCSLFAALKEQRRWRRGWSRPSCKPGDRADRLPMRQTCRS